MFEDPRIQYPTTDVESLQRTIVQIKSYLEALKLAEYEAMIAQKLYMLGLETESFDMRTDAFGRLRVSSPTTIFDSKQLFNNQPNYFDDQEVSGASTTSTWSKPRASTVIGVANTTAGKRVRQTFQRFNYQPGKSQLILCTGVLGTGGAGITAGFGYYDDDNGVFLNSTDGVIGMTIRSSVSGSPVDNTVVQADWNGDKLNGSGASGITLDPDASCIWFCDIEWLGVGTVRTGFVIDGVFILCHTFNHANTLGSVYMSTPNLPIRYEIENDGTGAAATLEHICSSVMSEGGLEPNGTLRYISTQGVHLDANSADTLYALIGLRLKANSIGQQIDFVEMSMIEASKADFEYVLVLNPTVAGTFTYADYNNSELQYALGVTANTVTGGTYISGGMTTTGSGGSIRSAVNNAIRLGAAIDGTRDEMVLCVRPLAANADVEGSMSWREVV